MYDSFKIRDIPLIDDTWDLVARKQNPGMFAVRWSFNDKEKLINGILVKSKCFKFYPGKGNPFFVQIYLKTTEQRKAFREAHPDLADRQIKRYMHELRKIGLEIKKPETIRRYY